MNSLTLHWDDEGKQKRQTIYDQQPSKNYGTVRLGRDPLRCDIVLTNPTVSGLHIEIFFDSQQRQFLLRNLRSQNPPLVDGQQLVKGELPLFRGSKIHLGQQFLQVSEVSIPPTNSHLPPTVIAPPSPTGNSLKPSSQPIVPQSPQQKPIAHHQRHENEEVQNPSYGLQCPNCTRVSSIEHLQVGCPWCGTSLAAAVSVLVAPKNQ
ncbi:MAG: FHA domain-containing protein [Cyanobacteria bacterium P01_A01_bin.84]